METIPVCGFPVAAVSFRRAVKLADGLLTVPGALPHMIFTPNLKTASLVHGDPLLRRALCASSLNLPDGVGVGLLAFAGGHPVPERIPGVDFGMALSALCEKRRLRLYLLGGMPGVAEKAAETLRARFPRLIVCGTHDGYFKKSGPETASVIADIKKARADVLFVCFGVPMQEKWLYRNRGRLSSLRLCIGLGGSLDIYAGEKRRAPKAMRTLGLEWLYRITREPERLPGFFRDACRLPALLWQTMKESDGSPDRRSFEK